MLIHIILGILKVIGILLLVILGILLLLLLSLLFVPVRYYGRAYRDERGWEGEVKISWLLHLISFSGVYGSHSERNGIVIRILGVPLETFTKIFSGSGKKKRNGRKGRKEKEKAEHPELTAAQVPEPEKTESLTAKSSKSETDKKKNILSEGKKEKEETLGRSAVEAVSDADCVSEKKEQKKHKPQEKPAENKKSVLEKLREIFKKIFSFPARIREKIKNFRTFIRGLKDKMKKLKELLLSDSFKGAKKVLMGELKYLFSHIRPRKIRGELSFGFSDPSLTGQILAAAGIFYPLYGKTVMLHPYFDKEILEGSIELKGRIRGVIFLHTAWVLFRDSNIKDFIKKYKH